MIANTTNIGVFDPGIIQFENANENRSYPFADNSVLEAQNGKLLPDNTIADLHLVVPMSKSAFLSSVYISEYMVSACIKIYSGSDIYGALSVIVSKDRFEPYIPYRLEKLTGSEDIGGIITFGNIAFKDTEGNYRFDDFKIKIEDSAVSCYQPAKLRSLIDDRTGKKITGDVNLVFSGYVNSNIEDSGVRLTLKPGASSILASSCKKQTPPNECGATPITSINETKPDDQDRIVLWFH